jgi:hypothetical protein
VTRVIALSGVVKKSPRPRPGVQGIELSSGILELLDSAFEGGGAEGPGWAKSRFSSGLAEAPSDLSRSSSLGASPTGAIRLLLQQQ